MINAEPKKNIMLKEYFFKNEERIRSSLGKSEFPNTSQALMNFYGKCIAIDDSLHKLDFKSNIYPGIILLRSQIEHFIVVTYIWIQFRLRNDDEIATIYYNEYLQQEVLKRIRYSESNHISMSSSILSGLQKLYDILLSMKVINQKDTDSINMKANQFDIRRISSFFDETLPLPDDNIIKSERIKSFLEFYNYFSSFVHGGPSAEAILDDENKLKIEESVESLLSWSTNIVGIIRIYILYFLALNDNDYEEDFLQEMNKIA